jgi:hypothetical protein
VLSILEFTCLDRYFLAVKTTAEMTDSATPLTFWRSARGSRGRVRGLAAIAAARFEAALEAGIDCSPLTAKRILQQIPGTEGSIASTTEVA